VAGCIQRAHLYQVSESEAREIVDRQIETIERDWPEVCDRAQLPEAERKRFWGRQFLNQFALEGL
jgi:serine/threonine-protein kinase HipA